MKPLKTHCIPFLLTVCLAQVGTVFAAPITWNGATDTDFATGTNWNLGVAPTNDLTTDIATFSGVPTANQPGVGTDRSVNGLNFTTGGWTLGGTGTLGVGTGGITSIGNNTIVANLSIDNGGAKIIAASTGGTLTLNKLSTGGSNANNLTFGTIGNAGTVVLGGTSDNGYLSVKVAYGTIELNKGTIGGTTDVGSAVDNLVVNSGATARYGANTTDRNGAAINGRGQIYGNAQIDGTLDLRGTGTFSDNWNIQHLSGSGVVTNNGTGAGRLQIAGDNGEASFSGVVSNGTGVTSIQLNLTGVQAFNNTANTYTGGTEILRGEGRFKEDGSLGAVPASASTNITMNGATARLMNSDSVLTVNANRTILIGADGGGFKAGWSKNVTIAGAVTGTGQVKIYGDSGTVVFAGINTYTGNTVMENNNSKFTLADDGSMLFQIGANGVNNQITGLTGGTALVTLNGDFNFNLALASIAAGNAWTIVDTDNLNETYGTTFTVNGFTEANDVWTKIDGPNVWTYTESTGRLTVGAIPEPSSLALLSALGVFGLVRRNRR